MAWRFSRRSLRNLDKVHPHLQAVARRALEISTVDFGVTEGKRTLARQQKLVDAGASKTLHSRHLTGHAIDVAAYVDGKVRWDWPLYHEISWAFKAAADELKVPLIWGGDWASFKDGPHYELDREKYRDA